MEYFMHLNIHIAHSYTLAGAVRSRWMLWRKLFTIVNHRHVSGRYIANKWLRKNTRNTRCYFREWWIIRKVAEYFRRVVIDEREWKQKQFVIFNVNYNFICSFYLSFFSHFCISNILLPFVFILNIFSLFE